MSAIEQGIIPQRESHAIDRNINPTTISDEALGLQVDGPKRQETTPEISSFFPETVIYQLQRGPSRPVRIHTSAIESSQTEQAS